MSVRVMLFVDGSWLFRTTRQLKSAFQDETYQIDYGKLPNIVRRNLSEQLDLGEHDIDVVRTNIFGSIPSDLHEDDTCLFDSQIRFYEIMKERHQFETYIHNIPYTTYYRGEEKIHRYKREDRVKENDSWFPKEKCVDVDLSTTMLFFAAIPHAYDIAVLIAGDLDYKPALKRVRDLGKRVTIAGVRGSTAREYMDPLDKEKIRDFEPILLNDYLDDLKYRVEKRQHKCKNCGKLKWSDYNLRRGESFFCDECRAEYKSQKRIEENIE